MKRWLVFYTNKVMKKKLIERLNQAIDALNNPKRLRKLPVSERYYNKRSAAKTLHF